MNTFERIALALIIGATICIVFSQMTSCEQAENQYWYNRAQVH